MLIYVYIIPEREFLLNFEHFVDTETQQICQDENSFEVRISNMILIFLGCKDWQQGVVLLQERYI